MPPAEVDCDRQSKVGRTAISAASTRRTQRGKCSLGRLSHERDPVGFLFWIFGVNRISSSSQHECSKALTSQSATAVQEKPPFTLSDLKRAVPPHCFHRSLLLSSAYLVFDLALVSLLFYLTQFLDHPPLPPLPPSLSPLPSLLPSLLWPLYWALQGCVLTGVWVVAHECGHAAFSGFTAVNDAVGMALHTALLVPYFAWKYSHKRHHSNTGSLDRDEVFVPTLKGDVAPYKEYLQHPFGRVLRILVILLVGWPLYLAFNASGRKYDGFANHFYPNSPIFNSRERLLVVVSDTGLLAMLGFLNYLGSSMGYLWLVKVYVIPLMVVNAFLTLITYLQHTHPDLPHYDDSEWDWLRGALSTVDRDFGILNYVFHHINDTHVAHHIFSSMPHYHAEEATKALKPILGNYYRYDDTPVPKALWREIRECVYVEPDSSTGKGVMWYGYKFK